MASVSYMFTKPCVHSSCDFKSVHYTQVVENELSPFIQPRVNPTLIAINLKELLAYLIED